jgi:hypothetical protein
MLFYLSWNVSNVDILALVSSIVGMSHCVNFDTPQQNGVSE